MFKHLFVIPQMDFFHKIFWAPYFVDGLDCFISTSKMDDLGIAPF